MASPLTSDPWLRTLLDASEAAVVTLTLDGAITSCNRRACELFGYCEDELVGKMRDELVLAEDRTRLRGGVAEREATGSAALVLRFVRRDGSIFEAGVTSVHEREGDRVWVLLRDLTARRLAERASAQLRDSNETLRALSDAAFEGVLIHSKGVIRTANRAAEIYARVGPGELVGRNLLEFIAPASRAEALAKIAAGDDRPYDAVARRADGSDYPVEIQVRTVPVELASESLRVCAIRDLSERRALEEQLRQAQKMEAIGHLAGGIAHDFNNLLSIILSAAELASDEIGDGHPAREDLDAVLDAGQRAATLTRQLLAFGRKQVLHVRDVDVDAALREMESMLRRLLGEDITLDIAPSPTPAHIRVDVAQLEQVVFNLAVNARDAMTKGGRLRVAVETVELGEDEARALELQLGPHVVIRIRDTGHGMDEHTRAHMFEPFFTTKELGQGTGLGLATVFGIVKQSGGSIVVDSAPGRGTTFELVFPASDAPRERPDDAPRPRPRSHTARVLVVEDEHEVRRVIVDVLRHAGHEVVEAARPTDALALVRSGEAGAIELLLTDLVMPGMGGRELAELVRAELGELAVLYTSGHAEHGDGAVVLAKPIAPGNLLDAVSRALASAW